MGLQPTNGKDPDIIVFGGGASNIAEIYILVPKLLGSYLVRELFLGNYVVGGECNTPVVPTAHGDSSGVRGAAWLNPL